MEFERGVGRWFADVEYGLHRTTVEFERKTATDSMRPSRVCIEPRWNLNVNKCLQILDAVSSLHRTTVEFELYWIMIGKAESAVFASNHGGI